MSENFLAVLVQPFTGRKMSEEQREKENRRAVKISVSLPAEVLEAARRAAADDSRTVSGYFQRLVVADLAADMKGGRP